MTTRRTNRIDLVRYSLKVFYEKQTTLSLSDHLSALFLKPFSVAAHLKNRSNFFVASNIKVYELLLSIFS